MDWTPNIIPFIYYVSTGSIYYIISLISPHVLFTYLPHLHVLRTSDYNRRLSLSKEPWYSVDSGVMVESETRGPDASGSGRLEKRAGAKFLITDMILEPADGETCGITFMVIGSCGMVGVSVLFSSG